MMLRTLLAGATLMTLGCAAVPPPGADGAAPVQGAGICDASKAQALVGRQRGAPLGSEALRLTRARDLRWIRPGDVVTMDFREDRLNIHVDAQGRVTQLRCG